MIKNIDNGRKLNETYIRIGANMKQMAHKHQRKIKYELCGPMLNGFDTILTPEALEFVAELGREFNQRRLALLDRRVEITGLVDRKISAVDLLMVPEGTITEQGLRINLSVGLKYMEAWLGGNGCVPINHLMEDAATAEISRSQLWQWVHHKEKITETNQTISLALVRQMMKEELKNIRSELGDEHYGASHFTVATKLFDDKISSEGFEPFLTIPAYKYLN
jgi:malate synthase